MRAAFAPRHRARAARVEHRDAHVGRHRLEVQPQFVVRKPFVAQQQPVFVRMPAVIKNQFDALLGALGLGQQVAHLVEAGAQVVAVGLQQHVAVPLAHPAQFPQHLREGFGVGVCVAQFHAFGPAVVGPDDEREASQLTRAAFRRQPGAHGQEQQNRNQKPHQQQKLPVFAPRPIHPPPLHRLLPFAPSSLSIVNSNDCRFAGSAGSFRRSAPSSSPHASTCRTSSGSSAVMNRNRSKSGASSNS